MILIYKKHIRRGMPINIAEAKFESYINIPMRQGITMENCPQRSFGGGEAGPAICCRWGSSQFKNHPRPLKQ